MKFLLQRAKWGISDLLMQGFPTCCSAHSSISTQVSGVAHWSKIGFVVDFRNLLFGCDFDLSFSKDYSLMKIFNYEVDFTAKCDT